MESRQTISNYFNPRSHCRERPSSRIQPYVPGAISIHVPIAGNDMDGIGRSRWPCTYFNPRSHCRERLYHVVCRTQNWYFNPRSHCRERRQLFNHNFFIFIISIHVPIAGNDYGNIQFFPTRCISIHVPIAGNDRIRLVIQIAGALFQSTFPLQGTTDQLFIFS